MNQKSSLREVPQLVSQVLIPDKWNKVGMALWRATGGSSEGLDLFDVWSAKCPRYDAAYTAAKWDGYEKCPPMCISLMVSGDFTRW